MRSKFDEQLHELNEVMIQMGTTIEENIRDSINAFIRQDVELAKEIMQKDEVVDRMQKEVESICFNLLIQQQPVARDLRTITAAMKMVTDMERIGDHAADISEMTILMSDKNQGKTAHTIEKMCAEALDMLIKSIDAFVSASEETAKEVIAQDDIVDDLFLEVKNELIALIKELPEAREIEIDMLMVAKYLERIADHATNISEWVLYSLQSQPRGGKIDG